ncbi:MAG: TrbG/VirB9 family P-type conjugative transfer protein [Alphaproteobacteria bacterium]|nr:TrbG/VirB9 family P-type conjugative transfer protein [Alphaproteobacteria bacterium]
MKKTISLLLATVAFPFVVSAQEMVPGAGFGTQTAWDHPLQNMGENQTKPGFERVNWEPGAVIPLRLRDGMLTVINFPEWETIRDAYVGDRDFFEGRPVEKNVFMISPVDGRSMADTNLFIFGQSGNKYVFYLRSEPFTTDRITSSIVDVNVPARFARGARGGASAGGGADGSFMGMRSVMGGRSFGGGVSDPTWEGEDFGWIKSVPVDPTEFRFDLDIFIPNPDDFVIAPERVWRDQVFTYIDFGEKALNMNQRPVVSLLVEDGESPVGFRTEGPQSRLLVVEAIGDLVLRSGGRLVCIKLRSKPYLLSNPPPPMDMIAVASVAGNAPGRGSIAVGGGFNGGFGGGVQGGQWTQFSQPIPGFAMAPIAPQAACPTCPAPRHSNHFVPLVRQNNGALSIEIFRGRSVSELEGLWLTLTERLPFMDEFTPFYSVETSGVDELGQQRYYGGEFYRLRIGPFERIEKANEICQSLSRHGQSCNIVRTQ